MTLEDKVAFLSRADAYQEKAQAVRAIETHMSWVFLTHRHAYKLKKPVRYGTLDYGGIAARRRNCEREVRLNRRLAPDIYLGTVALTLDASGLQLGGPGEIVDWLVKMRRLPASRTLERAIVCRTVRPTDIEAIGHRLSAFYRDQPSVAVDPEGYCRMLEGQILQNRKLLSKPRYALDRRSIEELTASQMTVMAQRRTLFSERARSGRIVEGHGDLRPEHIYLYELPLIVDCLEFDRRLRTVDPVSEIAFLSMECERLGADFVGVSLFATYRRETGDDPPPMLVLAYKCFHAVLRARIAIAHLDDLTVRQPLKWKRRTRRYFALGQRYARAFDRGDIDAARAGT